MIYKNKIIKWLAFQIWELSELLHIGLGNLAPYVFGIMIGGKPIKIKEEVIYEKD